MNSTVLFLILFGLVLIIASAVSLTTFGKKRPTLVLIAIFTAFTAYILIIFVRIGVLNVF